MASPSDKSPRQTRHLSFISEFTTDIRYVKGTDNVISDGLSRLHVSEIKLALDDVLPLPVADFKDEQDRCEHLADLQSSKHSLQLGKATFQGVTLLCDLSLAKPRPLVLKTLVQRICRHFHNLAHTGARHY